MVLAVIFQLFLPSSVCFKSHGTHHLPRCGTKSFAGIPRRCFARTLGNPLADNDNDNDNNNDNNNNSVLIS